MSVLTRSPATAPGRHVATPGTAGLLLDPTLPTPPGDREKYAYLGVQHRWLSLAQAVAFAMIGYGIVSFAVDDRAMLLFLAPVALYAVTLLLSLITGVRGRRVNRVAHDFAVRTWRPRTMPSVDVFLPTAGEPLEVLDNTYAHVGGLRWAGRLRVVVLDDGARPEVAELAGSYGFDYLSRPDAGRLKKAGNLRYGFDQTDGDLILILDADFAPRADMLGELGPYFEDAEVGIVQSPQYFDTRRRGMGWLERDAGATQELFYRFVQPSRDQFGAAICVGTCAVYRRSALTVAGGFAEIGHSEDIYTGVELMKHGYRLDYVPVNLATGLCPDRASAFVDQQYRWCAGSLALLRDRAFHRAPHITWGQRMCFSAGFLYYLSTAVNAVVAPLPALAMVWLHPAAVRPESSTWLLGVLALWFVLMPLVMKGRWRVDVLRVQHLYAFAHLLAVVDAVRHRARAWVATGARATTPTADTVLRMARGWVLLTVVGLWDRDRAGGLALRHRRLLGDGRAGRAGVVRRGAAAVPAVGAALSGCRGTGRLAGDPCDGRDLRASGVTWATAVLSIRPVPGPPEPRRRPVPVLPLDLQQRLDDVAELSRAPRRARFRHTPVRYVRSLGFQHVVYPRTHRAWRSDATTFFDSPMQVDLPAGLDIYLLGAKSHASEIRLARLMIDRLLPGATMVDVGAHFGFFTLLAGRLVGPSGRVLGFEAAPSTYRLLELNTADTAHVAVRHLALTERAATTTFHEFPTLYSEYNSFDVSQYEQERWYAGSPPVSVEVRTARLDDVLAAASAPDLVKIDVEGAEEQVIRGGEGVLREHRPLVVMEYLAPHRHNAGHRAAAGLLRDWGYRSHLITDTGGLEPCDDLEGRLAADGEESDNFAFLKDG